VRGEKKEVGAGRYQPQLFKYDKARGNGYVKLIGGKFRDYLHKKQIFRQLFSILA
jgi:hypothetical protein